MDILNNLVNVMNKEELRHFKLWLNSTNASGNRKDIQLFDYIKKTGENYQDEKIFDKLYQSGEKNSFYRLKHRLLEDLGYHLAQFHFGKSETNHLYLLLSLYNIFIGRNKPEIALYFLQKAEKEAMQSENFELLEVIYSNFVKLSSELTEINPEFYIKQQQENTIKLNKIRETDQVLAAVTYRLKLTQNYGRRDTGLLKLLDTTIKEFAKDASIKQSKSFQTRIFKAVSQTLIQSHAFGELEKFMLATYQRFIDENWFDKSNHEIRIQMLIYIINSTFKNRKFRESLDYAETLGEELEAFNKTFYNKYLFYYYNALVINYSQIDLVRALKALDEAEREMKGLKNSYYDFFIYLNKATLLFSQNKNDEAIRNLVKLYLNDHYKKADISFKLKIAVAECMMQYESGDGPSAKKRVEQVIKQFKEQLPLVDFKRERFILKIIPLIIDSEYKITPNTKIFNEISRFVTSPVKDSIEDGEVLKYRVWLAPKINVKIDL